MKIYLSYFYKTCKFFLLVFLCCIQTAIFAQTIVLEGEKEISSLGSSLSYYIQNESNTIEQVSNPNFDTKWLKNPSEHLNLGYNPNTVWLKIELENKSNLQDWNLILDFPYFDSITFYEPFIKNDRVENKKNIVSKWKIV